MLDISNSAGAIFVNPFVAKELLGWEQINNTYLTIINLNMTYKKYYWLCEEDRSEFNEILNNFLKNIR